MLRDIDMSEISDGKQYKSNDMVKCGCEDCKGCSDCCHGMGESIILDPYDINELRKATGLGFLDLMAKDIIELHVVDGVLLPNLKMQKDTDACIFLNNEGRCQIHVYRPGFCRLFPLGRIYEEDGFNYFLQIKECAYPNKTKVKIKKWLGIPNLNEYEQYIKTWHDTVKALEEEIKQADQNEKTAITVSFLKKYYEADYQNESGFYETFYKLINNSTGQ